MIENTERYFEQIQQGFDNKYNTLILPIVRPYENLRKLLLIVFCTPILALLAYIGIVLYTLISGDNSILKKYDTNNIIFFVFVVCSSSSAVLMWVQKRFEHKIKEQIMPIVCSCFPNMKWSHSDYSSGEFFIESGLISKFSQEKYDDIFDFVYSDSHIEIIEAEYKTGSDDNGYVLFDGVIVKIDMNKAFSTHTVVIPHKLLNKRSLSNLHYMELDNHEFNKKFDVFTDNDIEARSLLNPLFMEKLKNINTLFKAKKVSCVFFRSYLIIALHTRRDVFEIASILKRIDDKKQYLKMYEEIASILRLIDNVKVTPKTGL